MIRKLKASNFFPTIYTTSGWTRSQRTLVGGAGGARPSNSWTGRAGPGIGMGNEGRPPQQPIHRGLSNCPTLNKTSTNPQGGADLGHPHRRPAVAGHAPGLGVFRLAHGVFMGARTLGDDGRGRRRRRRPAPRSFAMLPFCGYNMGITSATG